MLKNVLIYKCASIYKGLQLPLRSVLGTFGSSYPLFTQVRGRGILRSSLSEVATWHTKIVHLGDVLQSASALQSDQSLSQAPLNLPPPKSSLASLLPAPRSCVIAFLM